MVRLHGGRTEPDVEVEFLGRLFDGLEADAPADFAGPGLGDQEFAVLAALGGGAGAGPAGVAAALRAVLDDPLVLLRRLDALAPLEHVVAARLLHVDVLAGLAGPIGDQGMPVIAGGHGDRVELLLFQGLADVLEALGRVLAAALHVLDPLVEDPRVRINEVRDLNARDAGETGDVVAAAPVDPGHADADPLVGPDDLVGDLRSGLPFLGALGAVLAKSMAPVRVRAAPAAAVFRKSRRLGRDIGCSLDFEEGAVQEGSVQTPITLNRPREVQSRRHFFPRPTPPPLYPPLEGV